MSEAKLHTVSSGNVYADLGFDEPEAELVKAELAYGIAAIIERRRWTQARAAKVLGIDQPKISAIVRGRLGRFSIDRLMRLLTRLDHDVRITVAPNPSPERPAAMTVRLLPEAGDAWAEGITEQPDGRPSEAREAIRDVATARS